MANYDAQINILVGGINRINDLENRLSRIQDTIEEINSMGAEGVFGRTTNLGVYSRALREINATADAVRRQTAEQQQANSATRDQLLLYSRLNREQNLFRRRSAAFTEESRGVRETNSRVIELTTQLRSAQRAFSALFADADVQGIKVLNTEISALLEELREINRVATGTKNVGANTAQLQAQADGWAGQIRVLRQRASALEENEEILARIAIAERNLIQLRNADMSFREDANVRLGKQELANASALIKAEENLASVRRRDAADYERQINRQSAQIKSVIQLAAKAVKAAGSATLDAVTFGKGSQVARGARNAAIRGGLGLGALGLGGAYAATQEAIGNIDLGVLQGPATQAATAIGGAINNALGGIPEIISNVLSALGDIPGALGLASVAALAFAPAMKTAGEAVYLAGKKFGESKFGENIKLTLERQTNLFESVINKASEMNMVLDASRSGLDAVGQAVQSLPALPAAGQTSFRGEMRRGRTGAFMGGGAREILNPEFLSTAAGVMAQRTQEAADTSLLFAEGLGQAAVEAKTIADYLSQANELRTKGESSTQRFIRQNIERGRVLLENQASAEIARERSAALVGGQYSLSQVPARGELFPGGRTETRQPNYREMLNNQAMIRQYVSDILETMSKQQRSAATLEQLERRTLGNVSEIVAARRSSLDIMQREQITQERINAENERSIQIIRERNKELRQRPIAAMTPQERVDSGIYDPATLRADRLRRVKAGRVRQEAIGRATSEGLVGGAFPLLFGQGVGASIGGLAGGVGGGLVGGGLGFGLALLGTALGTALDQLGAKATETGQALRDPIAGLEKLKEANLLASKAQEYYIKKLIEAGKTAQAAAIIQGEIIKKIGTTGVQDLNNLGKSSDKLSKAWAEFNLQLQAAVAGPLAKLLDWVSNIVQVGNQTNREVVSQQDILGGLSQKDRQELKKREAQILNRPGLNIFNEEARRKEVSALYKEFAPRATIQRPEISLRPETIEQQRKAAQQAADEIKQAYREAFSLQQQAIDLQRQGADLQRRVADDIFNKQQEIQRVIIDNDNKRKQIAIETVDLEYRKRISNEEGRVAQVLAAEAELMKTKKSGEAEIESKKRMLELDIAKQKRETENYIYRLNIDIDGIKRATLNYEMSVADYRLKIERQITEQRFMNQMGQVAPDGRPYYGPGGAAAGSGITGGARTSRKRDRDAEATGWDIVMPGGRGASVQAPIPLTITGTGFQGSGAGATGKGYGNWISGTFSLGGKNYELLLGHFDKISVAKGMQVPAGAELGKQGITGRTFGTHVTTHVNPMSGASVNDAWNALDQITKVWEGGSQVAQLQQAGSGIKRPQVPMTNAGATGAAMTSLAEQDAKLRRESLDLEQKLASLNEGKALQALEEVATGERNLKQRQDAINLLQNELKYFQAGSQEQQDRLALEAANLTKLQDRLAVDSEILQKTKLTGKEKEALINALAKGLEITKQQNALDAQALELTQKKRFETEKAALIMQGQLKNIGIKAGYIGDAAAAFEAEMRASGNLQQARELADLAQKNQTAKGNQMLEAYNEAATSLQKLATWENVAVTGAQAIGDAFGQAFREIATGTSTAKEILAGFFQNLANAFADMAASMIANLVQIALYKQMAGWLGMSPLGGGPAAGAASALEILPGGIPTIGGFLAAANGAAFSNGIKPFAMGGIVSSPTLFKFANGGAMNTGVMGEAGPEAIMPLSRGSDGKLGVTASGSGSSTNNVTVNVDATGSKVQGDNNGANQLGRAVAAAVQEELLRQKRPGGLLS